LLEKTINCAVRAFSNKKYEIHYGYYSTTIKHRLVAVTIVKDRYHGYADDYKGWVYCRHKPNIYSYTLNEFNARQRKRIKKCKNFIKQFKATLHSCEGCIYLNQHILKGTCDETYKQM